PLHERRGHAAARPEGRLRARLHVRRPPALLRRRAGEPRHHGAAGRARERARARGSPRQRAGRGRERLADRGRGPRLRLLPRARAARRRHPGRRPRRDPRGGRDRPPGRPRQPVPGHLAAADLHEGADRRGGRGHRRRPAPRGVSLGAYTVAGFGSGSIARSARWISSSGISWSSSRPCRYASYAAMSKWPWPEGLNRITCSVPASSARRAASTTPLIAWAVSGAGTIPSERANLSAASKTSFWRYASARRSPSSMSWETIGAAPW